MALTHDQVGFRTARLRIRTLSERDAERVYGYRRLPDVSRYQGWEPSSAEEVRLYAREQRGREACRPGDWAQLIIERRDGTLVGDIGFVMDEAGQQAEMGIALDPDFQHQGFAREAADGLVSWLFETFLLHRMHVSIDPANTPSRTLFERLGFRLEGHMLSAVFLKGQWCDDLVMAVLSDEWRAQSASAST